MNVGILIGWAWLHPAASACGGLTHSEGALAESDAEEVLFEVGSGEVAVSYAVQYRGDAADLGWVIPVPDTVIAVEDGDPSRFDLIRATSQPRVDYPATGSEGGGIGCACGGGGSKGGDSRSLSNSGGSDGGLTVIAEGFTGTYDYVVIEATDAAELDVWFSDHGWTGLAQDDLDHYIDAGATFVAIEVHPDSVDPTVERMLPPIRIRHEGDVLRFPAVMARHSPVLEQRETLYVLAPTRAALADGWTQTDPESITGSGDPTALWDAHLSELGADRGYSRTSAGLVYDDPALDGLFLTRFDTIAPTSVHDADADLVLEDSTDWIETRITLEDSASEAAIPLGLLVLLGAGWRRRRTA